jgi:hypothetical protein
MGEEVILVLGVTLAVGVIAYLFVGDVVTGIGRLNASQIMQYAANAGFTGDDLVTAVAIALAESGGDASNTTGDSGTSYGLWQIHWTVHPEFDKNQLTDPQYNANAAYVLFTNHGGFRDWSTYTQPDLSGKPPYTKFLPGALAAVSA